MKKSKKHRKPQPQTPDDLLIEQIREAFDVIPNRGQLPSSHEMPANAIIVETFAETCDVLGLTSCSDGKDLLAELLIESLALESDTEFQSGLSGIFYFLKICPPDAEPNASYTSAQIDCVRTWLLRIYDRQDLRMYDRDLEEILDLWHMEVVRHKQHWE